MNALEANAIQRLWMDLDSGAPEAERRLVLGEFGRLPKSYISQHSSGKVGQVMVSGSPYCATTPIENCVAIARRAGVQTELRWIASGEWKDFI